LINGAEALVSPGRINPIYLEGKLLPLGAPTAAELNLKDGQVVQGLMRLHGDQPSLFLKGKLIDGPFQNLAPIGESVWLKVESKAQGPWSLMPVPAPHALQPNTGILGALPQSPSMPTGVAPWISKIATLLYRPPGTADLSQLYRPGTLDALLQSVPRPDLQAQWRNLQLSMAQLTPAAIRQAMANAIGAEVWLAKGMSPPIDDPKQLIRKLIEALDQIEVSEGSEGESIGKLHAAIDDLEASQVQAVQAQAQREVLFSMTLPFKDANPVELTIRRGPRQEGEPPVLTVNVHSKTENLGPVWLKTQLMKSQEVDLTMWATDYDVVQLAKNQSNSLGQELQVAGLSMRSFQVVHGPRPEPSPEWTPSGRGLVVDISA
jgi:hypothetical protein